VFKIRHCRPVLIAQECVTEVLASQVCEVPDLDHPSVTIMQQHVEALNITVNHICRENVEGYSYSELSTFLFLF